MEIERGKGFGETANEEQLIGIVSSQEKPADFRHKPYNFFTDFLLWSGDAPVDSCYQSYL
jgi:hypothetical protein